MSTNTLTLIAAGCGIVLLAAVAFMAAPMAPIPCQETPSATIPEITISGSTTIQPVSELLATAWMDKNPGTTVHVKGGGSGAGISDAAEGHSDIGSASRPLKEEELKHYSDLAVHQIGGSAIVVIVPESSDVEEITFEELVCLYDAHSEDISAYPHITAIRTVIQRSEPSGTEETFAKWLFQNDSVDTSLGTTDTTAAGPVTQMAAGSNNGVLSAVKEHPDSIGFVDFGYAEFDPGVRILKVRDADSDTFVPKDITGIRDAILNELRPGVTGQTTDMRHYIPGLTRPLNYITTKNPDPSVAAFIAFAQSDAAAGYFHEIGYFSITEML